MCNALEINIHLISTRTDGKKSDVEHYPTSPHIKYDETYNLGLIKNHYFINDYTELTTFVYIIMNKLKTSTNLTPYVETRNVL